MSKIKRKKIVLRAILNSREQRRPENAKLRELMDELHRAEIDLQVVRGARINAGYQVTFHESVVQDLKNKVHAERLKLGR